MIGATGRWCWRCPPRNSLGRVGSSVPISPYSMEVEKDVFSNANDELVEQQSLAAYCLETFSERLQWSNPLMIEGSCWLRCECFLMSVWSSQLGTSNGRKEPFCCEAHHLIASDFLGNVPPSRTVSAAALALQLLRMRGSPRSHHRSPARVSSLGCKSALQSVSLSWSYGRQRWSSLGHALSDVRSLASDSAHSSFSNCPIWWFESIGLEVGECLPQIV